MSHSAVGLGSFGFAISVSGTDHRLGLLRSLEE